MLKKEIKQELESLIATAELRSIPDNIDKAIKILFDYCGEKKNYKIPFKRVLWN